MDPNKSGAVAVVRIDGIGDAFEGMQRLIDRGQDCGCKVLSDATCSQETADGTERLGGALHDVVACCSMSVDVEKGRRQRRVFAASCGGVYRLDQPISDRDDRMIDGALRRDQAT